VLRVIVLGKRKQEVIQRLWMGKALAPPRPHHHYSAERCGGDEAMSSEKRRSRLRREEKGCAGARQGVRYYEIRSLSEVSVEASISPHPRSV
jgi:hypothetical protein